jgi:hypothetical protein
MQNLQLPAAPHQMQVHFNKRPDAAAVHVGDAGQIDDQPPAPGRGKRLDLIAKDTIAFVEDQVSTEFEYRNPGGDALRDL